MRTFILMVNLFIVAFLGIGCSTTDREDNRQGVELSWTFLFYDDADFYDAYDPWDVFINRMYSGDNIHVLVLRDQGFESGGIYYIHPDQSYEKVEHLSLINMGDPATITRFIQFARSHYPAERYIISFYDHGGGFNGACIDHSHDDMLSMPEIREGLANGGGVDVVLWSAPCLMGAIECMYELRNQTEVYVGSEGISGYCYWKYAMADIRDLLTFTPGITTRELGKNIVSAIEDKLWMMENEYYGQSRFVTISAVRTDKINDLVDLLAEIVRYYLDYPQKYIDLLDGHYSDIETYGESNDFNMDMFSWATFLINQETDPSISSRLSQLRNRIGDAVIAEIHGEMYPDTHGIAIHHPNRDTFEFHDQWLGWYQVVSFAAVTRWDELMVRYLGITAHGICGHEAPVPILPWMFRRGNGETVNQRQE